MKFLIKAKCRNCGAIFIYGNQNEVSYSKEEIKQFILTHKLSEEHVAIHECSDIEWGIADGIGFIIEG